MKTLMSCLKAVFHFMVGVVSSVFILVALAWVGFRALGYMVCDELAKLWREGNEHATEQA